MTNRTTKEAVFQRRRSAISDPERVNVRERNRAAANKCRRKKKREHEQLERRLSDENEKKDILLSQLNCLREEVWYLKNMIIQHAGCEDQQIGLQLARMTWNVLNDPNKWVQPVHEASPLPALSSGTLSDDPAGSDSQPNGSNNDSYDENDWALFPRITDDLMAHKLNVNPDSMFVNFVNMENVYT
ncbi:transcriptional regulator family: bZIP [Penicillium roqueforti]|nr:transcriptional regulator family: bZIP [Penicillium roqueforti]KAI3185014.1 transcriptional regulator family: bZIP [Penicillium roqueforti]